MSGTRDPDILNIEEAAQLLGVSVKTFNKVLHSQDLPARKIGREWKFSRLALIEWVGSGRSSQFYRDQPSEDGADTLLTPTRRAAQRTDMSRSDARQSEDSDDSDAPAATKDASRRRF